MLARAPAPSPASVPLFLDATTESGLSFAHDNGATGQFYMPEMMGAGVALFDYDKDGDLDVYLVQGEALGALGSDPRDARGGQTPGNRLFRNDGSVHGVPHFTDVTAQAGVGRRAVGMGIAVGDVDNDGRLDLYLTAFGSNVLYRNRGDGTFEDVTAHAQVDDPRWTTSAAFIDYDRDGDQDLFLANYVAFTRAGNKVCTDHAGARDYCPPGAYAPVPTRLFRNDGALAFTDVTDASGVSRAYGAGLGVAVGDLDGDGWPDVYVANDATPNQLWFNRHDGTFEDRGLLSGTAFNALGRPEGSMGIALGDADSDGDEDLFVTNIIGESHVLYLNDGTGNFEDARTKSGLGAATAGMTGFGAGWIDYDNDGRLDFFLTNGAVNIIEAERGEKAPYRQRSQLLHNEGGGRFREVSGEAGRVLRAAPRRARRGVRRPRQRRRRRHRGDHEQRAGRAAAEPDTHARHRTRPGPSLARARPAQPGQLADHGSARGRRARGAGHAAGDARGPTAATCRPATGGCTSAWETRPRSTGPGRVARRSRRVVQRH